MDRFIIRGAVLMLFCFIAIAILYERPVAVKKRAAYLPEESVVGNKEKGRELFGMYCVQCHGMSLDGTDKGPSLLHAYYKPDHHGDLSIYLAVYQGVQQHHWYFGNMPAVTELRPEQVTHIIKYIRDKQRESGLY